MSAILWLDNDPGNIVSLVSSLRSAGHEVTVCRTVSSAERALTERSYDLLVLDVMIPVEEEEVADYPFDETEDTLATGLVFYRRMKKRLAEAKTAVLVITVRIDSPIADAFAAAGLPKEQFATRFALRNTKHFMTRVADILKAGGPVE